ncbi:MAG: alanine racemase [Coxiellaceae bacterium]|nr:alanine racemase [Coxiellaceae bacterium]
MHRATAFIDCAALQHNCRVVRRLIGNDRKIMAMIKADGYGHGLLQSASALNEVDAFGVATVNEAVFLREAGIAQDIVVMGGFTTLEELALFFQHQLTPVIHSQLQLELLDKISVDGSIAVWLKIDTGMHRLGFSATAFPEVYARLSKNKKIQQPVQLMTHLADADNPDRSFTEHQIATFSKLTDGLPGLKSIANSATVLAYPEVLRDMVRPGIMLYGVSPIMGKLADSFHLQPVMHLKSKLIAINHYKKGDKIGYGCTWECPEPMRVGVVAMGYGDGYPRHIENGTPVLINNVLCPTVGRVSMDMMTVDLRSLPNAKVGDHVVLWGHGLPVEKIAASAGTIPYELLCQLTQRVEFFYVDQDTSP